MTIGSVLSGEKRWCVECGDALAVLKTMPDACVDSLVCDPPAGISFLGKGWDSDKGGRDHWIAWLESIMRECLRVMKPGAHGLVWALPRTSHWTATALENAGFDLRDRINHLFSSGFPKSRNISKAIDARLGATRNVIGQRTLTGNAAQTTQEKGGTYASNTDSIGVPGKVVDITAPGSHEAEQWDDWGTALKPAAEDWWLIRKPFKGTIEACVLANGCGAINVGGCRIITSENLNGGAYCRDSGRDWSAFRLPSTGKVFEQPRGRWPAHLLFSHAPGCKRVGERKVKAAPPWGDNRGPSTFAGTETSPVHHAEEDGTETVETWECVKGCPVKLLDEQGGVSCSHDANIKPSHAGMGYGGGGGSSRIIAGDAGPVSRYFTQFPADPFFYQAKPSRAERERGCERMAEETVGDGRDKPIDNPYQRGKTQRRNVHTTVKSVELMRWLCRLVTQPNGVVLDCFMGSGSTGVAALKEGFRFIGVEREPQYVEIAKARIVGDAPLFNLFAGAK